MPSSAVLYAVVLSWPTHMGRAASAKGALLDDAHTCPGPINMTGYGTVEIVATKWNIAKDPASKVDVVDGKLMPLLKGRSYFADACQAGKYDYKDYAALKLLGKTLSFTTDLSGLGCGCNAAFYMTNMQQNSNLSTCEDYYCDANSVCGVACEEIDIMEANMLAYHATLHTWDDTSGSGGGYGGGGEGWNGPRDWNSSQYGPGGSCIDTHAPFRVATSFPVDGSGKLAAMTVTLSQAGQPCNLSISISGYDGNKTKWPKGAGHGMLELTEALTKGMTPIASFWESEDMLWMDGKGDDQLGPCKKDLKSPCPSKVPMYDFAVADIDDGQQEGTSWMLWVLLAFGVLVAVLALVFGARQVLHSRRRAQEPALISNE